MRTITTTTLIMTSRRTDGGKNIRSHVANIIYLANLVCKYYTTRINDPIL